MASFDSWHVDSSIRSAAHTTLCHLKVSEVGLIKMNVHVPSLKHLRLISEFVLAFPARSSLRSLSQIWTIPCRTPVEHLSPTEAATAHGNNLVYFYKFNRFVCLSRLRFRKVRTRWLFVRVLQSNSSSSSKVTESPNTLSQRIQQSVCYNMRSQINFSPCYF